MKPTRALLVLLAAVASFADPAYILSAAKVKARALPPPSQPAAPVAQPQPAMPAAPAIESGPSAYPTQCPAEGTKISVAVYPIKPAGSEPSLATAMTALISSKLTPSPKLRVIEEAMLKTVIERQAMNISDACDDTVCQVAIGKLVQAQKLISGDLVKFGSKYVLSLKLTDVQNGTLDFATEEKCACTEDQLDQLIAAAAAKVRNHFCDAVPVPVLPQAGSMSMPSPAPPKTLPEGAPSFNPNSATSAMVFLYFSPVGTSFGTPRNSGFQIDSQKFYLKKGECAKKVIAAGDHHLGAYQPQLMPIGPKYPQYPFRAESGGNYYFETLGGQLSHISQVSAEAASAWAQNCQQLP